MLRIGLACEVCQPRPWTLCSLGKLPERPKSQGFPQRIFRRYAMNFTQTNLDLLASRVQKLEASNRRWKFVNALLLLTGVSVVLMVATPPDPLNPPLLRAHQN